MRVSLLAEGAIPARACCVSFLPNLKDRVCVWGGGGGGGGEGGRGKLELGRGSMRLSRGRAFSSQIQWIERERQLQAMVYDILPPVTAMTGCAVTISL